MEEQKVFLGFYKVCERVEKNIDEGKTALAITELKKSTIINKLQYFQNVIFKIVTKQTVKHTKFLFLHLEYIEAFRCNI